MKAVPVLVLFALLTPALGTSSPYSQKKCITEFGPTVPASVATTTVSRRITLVEYENSTTTPSVTVTPEPVTISTIVTSVTTITTTLSQVTDAFSATSTLLETTTISSVSTVTAMETALSTTVQTPPAYTVPTPPGFTPLGPRPAITLLANKLKRQAEGQDELATATNPPETTTAPLAGYPQQSNLSRYFPIPYPISVTCSVVVEVSSTSTIISTAKSTAMVTATASTFTSTSRTVVTSTSLVTPADASITFSFFTTSTVSTTVTSNATTTITTTSTVTDIAPASTVYAACAPNNILSYLDGKNLTGISISAGFQFGPLPGGTFPASNAYDCCVQCMTAEQNCGGAVYGINDRQSYCFILGDNGDCIPSRSVASFALVDDDEYPLELSNGYCGQWALESD